MAAERVLQLNSASPRRRELLQQIGARFTQLSAAIDETPLAGELPEAYVKRLACGKARAGFECSPLAPCMGSDTIVVAAAGSAFELLGKPKNKQDALRMLSLLSGRSHTVYTAVSICDAERMASRLSVSTVTMKPLSEQLMESYWASGEAADKAGAYGIQGLAAAFIESLHGSYSGVMGLPLAETLELLDEFRLPHALSAGQKA
ncbi:Maf family protein [Agaribacterium haliotis]|uniref:Maf family protein n=1 Tax=Agaribacterium haliotis TaxID=2013869 RepID=UPI000BB58689|nr:Maf family protein [Agaribacterium haliotis]